MHEFLREMNQMVLDKYDAVTVGELPHTPDPQHVLRYVGARDRQLSMVFQFDIVDIGLGLSYKYRFRDWKLPTLKGIVAKWQQFIEGTDGWTTAFCEKYVYQLPPLLFLLLPPNPWYLFLLDFSMVRGPLRARHTDGPVIESHDQGRSVSRYASDAPEYRAISAKLLSLMLCALTGTLFIYQGQEIGMINVPKDVCHISQPPNVPGLR